MKKLSQAKFKEFTKTIEKNTLYTECEIFNKVNEYFSFHPNYHTVLNRGLKGYIYKENQENQYGKSWCWFTVDFNNNYQHISMNYTIDNEKAKIAKVKAAFRSAVKFIIDDFRKSFIPFKTKCEISGLVIGDFNNLNIDHYDLDFEDLLADFLAQHNKDYLYFFDHITQEDSNVYLTSESLKQEFIEFHNQNTNLRFTTKSVNVKRNRKTNNMLELREYQEELSEKAVKVLRVKNLVYLTMQVRTGKTATSLNVAKLYGAKKVLFLTKKKAIGSIESDYVDFGFNNFFELAVINDESLHKVVGEFDLIIHDEHHRFGSFPKPSKGAQDFKLRFSRKPMIFLSGTPTPESFSQIFHQFWVSIFSPFGHGNFYAWAKEYVNVTQKNLGFGLVNDYSNANKDKIDKVINDYMISFTQQEAGFSTEITEKILYVDIKDTTKQLIQRLKKDLFIQGKEESITADTAAKLMQKVHQLYSGTIKFDSGNKKVLDHSKAEFISQKFAGKKIAIFYKFTEELEALRDIFKDQLTTDLEEFNTTDKNFAVQIVSGREGISLRNAEFLVYYNIDFSATSYWQSRDRLTFKDRAENQVYWIFSSGGIESKILNAVSKKKNYTLSYFKQDYEFSIKN